MRYTIVEEREKQGRKTFVQYAVYDTHEGRVIARYAKRKSAQWIIDQYETAVRNK